MLWCLSMNVLLFSSFFKFFSFHFLGASFFWHPSGPRVLFENLFSLFIQIIMVVHDNRTSRPKEQKYLIINGHTRSREPNQNVLPDESELRKSNH